MKRLILTAMLLCVTATPLFGRIDSAAQQRLSDAEKQANLFGGEAPPFQIDVDFTAQFVTAQRGHLTYKWEAKDRWWRRVDIDGFEQIEVRNGDKIYTARNANFTPVRVRELINLLEFADGRSGRGELIVKKEKLHRENGVDLDCLQGQAPNTKDEPHQVCLNATTHEMLSDEWKESPDELRREEFSNFIDFAGYRYPRDLQRTVNGSKAVSANVTYLVAAPFDQTLLVPPKGAIERRTCAGWQHPVAIKTPDPGYPRSASENKMIGDTTVSMTVLADGSVTDIQVVGRASQSMDDATLKALKGWKFKPAMCRLEPVVSDITVIVSFRIN